MRFESLNLNGADFRDQDLRDARFASCNLNNADFTGAQLKGARFASCNLNGATFPAEALSTVQFASCNMGGVRYVRAIAQESPKPQPAPKHPGNGFGQGAVRPSDVARERGTL